MRYVAAYLLATLGGNETPTVADIEKILGSVGVDVDKERLQRVISQLEGKNLDEIIAEGKSKLVPTNVENEETVTDEPVKKDAPAEEMKEEAKDEDTDEEMSMFSIFD